MMKNWTKFLGALLLLAVVTTSCGNGEHYAKTYYVATDGDDANPGTRSQPFATLEKARDQIRELKKSGALPEGGIRVMVADGNYTRTTIFHLTAEDSGTETAPIVYGGASKTGVRFIGGKILKEWEKVSSPDMLARLDPTVREKVMQTDLKKAGITRFGVVAAKQGENQRADLFCNGQYMSLARYPDKGEWARIADVPMNGPKLYYYDNVTHYGRFAYDGDRPSRWKDQSDLWMEGFFVHDWSFSFHKIEQLDTIKKEVHPQPPYHHYGYKKGQRYYFANVFEELTAPGEWYLDRESGMLYFYPPCEIDQAEVIFPDLEEPMIVAEGTEYVAIEGVTFQASRDKGVVLKDGFKNEIRGCDFLNFGRMAIQIDEGSECGVLSCDVHDVAETCIGMNGGDRKTLTPCNHYVDNCELYNMGTIFKTYNPGVRMVGVGMRVANCFIHDSPNSGILYYGNDFLIEYCEFTAVAQETGDVGCINTGMNWTFLGHTIRYNYFHDIHGPGHLGCFTIYPDLPCGGIHLYGNIFYNTDWIFNTNSGRWMVIENNLLLNSHGFSYKVWPFKAKFLPGGDWQMVERIDSVRYDQPPYSTRYPELLSLAADFKLNDTLEPVMQRQLCKDNLIRNNIATGTVFLRFTGPVDLKQVRAEKNLIATDAAYSYSPINTYDDFDSYVLNDPAVMKELEAAGNQIMMGTNPGIKDPANGDFSFVPGSPAAEMKEFKPIPFDQIGLKADRYRTLKK